MKTIWEVLDAAGGINAVTRITIENLPFRAPGGNGVAWALNPREQVFSMSGYARGARQP